MGERAAYRAAVNGKVLFMIRKQWYLGSTHKELSNLVKTVASNLMNHKYTGVFPQDAEIIGGGLVALRPDLNIGRLSMALLNAVSSPPFDEVVEADELNCDINDHGIFEINMLKWNKWEINHYPVKLINKKDVLGTKKQLATVTFAEGKPFPQGMKINFTVQDDWEYQDYLNRV